MTPRPHPQAPGGTARRFLIVNADDLGFVPSVSRGIVESMETGVVRSASLMVNMPDAEPAAQAVGSLRTRGHDVGVGLHLNLVVGHALTGRSALTDAAGAFRPLHVHAWQAWRRRLDVGAVEAELRAQFERAAALLEPAGLRVSHIDSHRHAHCLPGIYEVVLRVARELGVPHVRQPIESPPTLLGRPRALLAIRALRALLGDRAPHDDIRFAGVALMRSPTFQQDLALLFASLPWGGTELMVHPGYDSPALAAIDSYRDPRERELRALTAPETHRRLTELGVQLTHFGATAPSGSAPTPAARATP